MKRERIWLLQVQEPWEEAAVGAAFGVGGPPGAVVGGIIGGVVGAIAGNDIAQTNNQKDDSND